uniref:Uncharacterized protein n=1 Tax=Oryza rufipogon TaxID=4529 RepID=A0A0E0QKD3_ORYRU
MVVAFLPQAPIRPKTTSVSYNRETPLEEEEATFLRLRMIPVARVCGVYWTGLECGGVEYWSGRSEVPLNLAPSCGLLSCRSSPAASLRHLTLLLRSSPSPPRPPASIVAATLS